MSFLVNGIPLFSLLQQLSQTGGGKSGYKITNGPGFTTIIPSENYTSANINTNYTFDRPPFKLNYQFNGIDLNNYATCYNETYDIYNSVNLNTSPYNNFKHISFIMCGGTGGGGGGGGAGWKGSNLTAGGDGGDGGSVGYTKTTSGQTIYEQRPPGVIIQYNISLNSLRTQSNGKVTKLNITVGTGGPGGAGGARASSGTANNGKNGDNGSPGNSSYISVETHDGFSHYPIYYAPGSSGGGGGGSGNSGGSGGPGGKGANAPIGYIMNKDQINKTLYTYDETTMGIVNNSNICIFGVQTKTTIAGGPGGGGGNSGGGSASPGDPGKNGWVRIWYSYEP